MIVKDKKILLFTILNFVFLFDNQDFLKANYQAVYQEWFLKNEISIQAKNQGNGGKGDNFTYFFKDKPSKQIKKPPKRGQTNVWLYQKDENFKLISIYYLGRDLNPIYTIDFKKDKPNNPLTKYTFYRNNDKQNFSPDKFKVYYFDAVGKIVSFVDNQHSKGSQDILKINYDYQSLDYTQKDFDSSNYLTDYLVSKKAYLNNKLKNEKIEIYRDNLIQQKSFLKIENKKKTKMYEVYYQYENNSDHKLINQKITEFYYYPEGFIFKTNIHYWLNGQLSHSYFGNDLVRYQFSNKQLRAISFLLNRHSQSPTTKKIRKIIQKTIQKNKIVK